jgi:co-chaperonin GroES (HSP10)
MANSSGLRAPTYGVDGFHQMQHDADARKLIIDTVAGRVPTMLGAKVCIVTYVRPEKTAGGIIRPDTHKREDFYQGKVGLLIGLGPIAFQDDDKTKFGNVAPKLHDWVMFSSSHGYQFSLNGLHARLMDDVMVQSIVQNPDWVY